MAQIYVTPPPKSQPLRQGEIICGLTQLVTDLEKPIEGDRVYVERKNHPYVIVVTQDCDLEQDHQARLEDTRHHRWLPNILFCEVHKAEPFLNNKENYPDFNSKSRRQIQQNRDLRFQFLEAVPERNDSKNEGLPELVVEFKRYFTLPTEEIYYRIKIGEAIRRCYLRSPYLEHFSTRYNFYQNRVALPEDHQSI